MPSTEAENSSEAVTRDEPVGVLDRLLRARGLFDDEAQAAFRSPRMADLHFPETLPGAEAAAVRLVEAVRGGRSIAIYGDYDVDGIMSSSILYHVLALADPDNPPKIYVPHRIDEGYGLNIPAIETLASEGVEVLISVDCGVTAIEPALRAKELGIELIITDHHTAVVDDLGAVVLPDVYFGCLLWGLLWASTLWCLLGGGYSVVASLGGYSGCLLCGGYSGCVLCGVYSVVATL